jgi:hypothetical protein
MMAGGLFLTGLLPGDGCLFPDAGRLEKDRRAWRQIT